MPLRQTKYGGQCPLGVFEIDRAGGGGSYTTDPIEACFGNPEQGIVPCNYFRMPGQGEEFCPEKQCMCPSDMTKERSRKLKQSFLEKVDAKELPQTKQAFWDYIKQNPEG